jgi:uncharacterized protein (DUF305 family)
MSRQRSLVCTVLLVLGASRAIGQQAPSVPLLQPGAPGQPTTTITKPTVGTAVKEPTEADFKFMQDMVMHHSQAVEMVGLMQTRTKNPALLELGKRISISQGDEILFMKRWLAFYERPVADDNDMAKMDMAMTMDMSKPMDMDTPMMPGMLSPRQMETLRRSKGAEFDRLFLTGMIQHHTGALSMVKDLFDVPGAGQEPQLFDFTADVDVTQRGEIATMQDMLVKEKK